MTTFEQAGFKEILLPPQCQFCGAAERAECPETHQWFTMGYWAGRPLTSEEWDAGRRFAGGRIEP